MFAIVDRRFKAVITLFEQVGCVGHQSLELYSLNDQGMITVGVIPGPENKVKDILQMNRSLVCWSLQFGVVAVSEETYGTIW